MARPRAPRPTLRSATTRTAWTLARDVGLAVPTSVADDGACPTGDVVVELAWDGVPVLACRVGDDIRIFGQGLRDWSEPFAAVRAALKALAPNELVLAGTIVVLVDGRRASFAALKDWVAGNRSGALAFVATDLLHVGDVDLRAQPLSSRRARLAELLEGCAAPLVLSQALPGALAEVRASVARMGLTGLVVRRATSVHPPALGDACTLSATDAPLAADRTLSPSPKVTNADKVLYPRDGITKREIAAYYADVAPVLLLHMKDRPVVAQRWPDGIDDFTWYQHRVPPRAPDYLRPVVIDGDRRLVFGSADALGWMVNQAALTFHGWTSRVGTLDAPDWVVLDLDPGERTTWKQTIDVALALRRLLELLEVESVVKTSGKRGLHVLVPLAPGETMARAQTFAQKVALLLVRLLPDVVTIETEVEKRRGRLYFDHLNFRAKSLVLPYALRDADGAPVSTPLRWDEVHERLDPRAFGLRTLRARLDAVGDVFAPVLRGTTQLDRILAKM